MSVVLDLEDAVAHEDKTTARVAVAGWIASGGCAVVRINASDTIWHSADAAMIREVAAPVMLPKTRSPDEIDRVVEITGTQAVPLVETSSGVLAAAEIARHPEVARIAFGSIDMAAELGIDPEDRDALLFARSTIVMASAAAGLAPPIDGVTTTIDDPNALNSDVAYAARIGMSAKLCIHPRQIPTVHECLVPSVAQIDWAQRIVASTSRDGSAVAVDGRMVDAPFWLALNALWPPPIADRGNGVTFVRRQLRQQRTTGVTAYLMFRRVGEDGEWQCSPAARPSRRLLLRTDMR